MGVLVNPFMVLAAGGGATVPGAPSAGFDVFEVDDPDYEYIVRWNVPASDGGSAITGYKVYINGSLQGTYGPSFRNTSTFPITVGDTHTAYVTATNAIGESAPSNTVTISP